MKPLTQLIGTVTILALLGSCGGGTSDSGTTPNVNPVPVPVPPPGATVPTITATSPANGDTNVAVTSAIRATFSQAMNPATVNAATFTLNNGVIGIVSYDSTNNTATFLPSHNLAASTTYVATVGSAVRSAGGSAMAADYSWTFTTGIVPGVATKLNDTGITSSQCYEAGGNIVSCGSSSALALNNAQDGMVGRDVDGATNSNADGKLGFSFTALSAAAGGCVIDNVTGLMWEIKTTDGGLRDAANTYTNLGNGLAGDSSGYIAAVNESMLCGYSDWRLPTAEELLSLVDYSVVAGTMIDTNWFPNTRRIYWSSDPAPWAGGSWYVDFGWGNITAYANTTAYSVRLVRGGSPPPVPRYYISPDGQEVTDTQTGLIWRRCAEGMTWSGTTCTGSAILYTHEQALQLAAAQAASGGKAWRLPNAKELSSILERSQYNPAIDTTVFPATPASVTQLSEFWSATPFFGYGLNTGLAISVDFTAGGVDFINRTLYPAYVRLVR